MGDLDKPKGPEAIAETVPEDILRKTRFTRIEGPDGEPPRIHFYERVPEKGGSSVFSVDYNLENNSKYYPAPQEVPPYTADELAVKKAGLRARFDAVRDKIDSALAQEMEKRIDTHELPRSLNVVEDDLFVMEERFGENAIPKAAEVPTSEPDTVEITTSADDVSKPKVQPKVMGQRQGQSQKSPEQPKAPSLPPLEEKPYNPNRPPSKVKSPFSREPQGPEAVMPGPDAYVPASIQRLVRAEPRTELGEPPTMQEILNNPKKQELFGMVLEATDRGREILAKFMTSHEDPSTMTDADHMELQVYRIDFQRRMLLLDEVSKRTTPADLEFALKNDPAFVFLRNSTTSARATEIIRLHMDKVFMRMSDRQLTRVVEASRANHDIRRSDYYREMHQGVAEKIAASQKENPGQKTFDPLSTTEWMTGDRAKMLDFLKPGMMQRLFSSNAISAENSALVLESIEMNRTNIMRVLASTISNDTELKRHVAKEVIEGVRVPEIGAGGPVIIDEMWQEQLEGEIKIANTDDLRRRIRDTDFRFKVGNRTGKSWEEMDPEEREEGSYEVLQDEGKLPQRRRGFFGLWLSSIFSAAFPDMQNKLANEFEQEK